MSDSVSVGILYPGEMGAAFGAMLVARGVRTVTTLKGRSGATGARCEDAGIKVLASMAEVVRESGVVFSFVPPSAAEEVAIAYCEVASLAPVDAFFVDVNSIGPEQAALIGTRVSLCGREFVDAAVNGLAKNLTSGGTLFLSGPRAGAVAQLVGDGMRVRVLGDRPGRASAMKMLLSGLSKGLCALFVENALVARRQGMLAPMIEAYSTIYPGVMAVVERMLPTYAQHAGRRAVEMNELTETARGAGVEPCVLEAVRELHDMMAGVDFDATPASVAAMMELLDREQLLSVVRAGEDTAR